VAERIRFHLDEHIDPDIAAALRRHGVDATTTTDAGLRAANDDAQLDSGAEALATRAPTGGQTFRSIPKRLGENWTDRNVCPPGERNAD
jgi:hypothetical protein